MTAWSSSRLQRSSSPWVTATWAWRGGRLVGRGEPVDEVPTEAEPREEKHEANHQQPRAPAIGFLLLKQIERCFVRHALGFSERSTCGTARSPWSVISHRSAGWARASPATSDVGNCCWRVLYWVAVSL